LFENVCFIFKREAFYFESDLFVDISSEVNKIVTRKGSLNCDPLKIILKLKSDSQVVYLEWLS